MALWEPSESREAFGGRAWGGGQCAGAPRHELALSAWPQVGQPSSQARPPGAMRPSPKPAPPTPTPTPGAARPPPKPPLPRPLPPGAMHLPPKPAPLEGVRPPAEAGAASGADEGGPGTSSPPGRCQPVPKPPPSLWPDPSTHPCQRRLRHRVTAPKRLLSFRTVRTSPSTSLPCPPFLGKASVGPMCRGCGAGPRGLQRRGCPWCGCRRGSVVWCPGRGPVLRASCPLSQDGHGVEGFWFREQDTRGRPTQWLPAATQTLGDPRPPALLCVRLEGCLQGGGGCPQGLLCGRGGAGPGRDPPGWPAQSCSGRGAAPGEPWRLDAL